MITSVGLKPPTRIKFEEIASWLNGPLPSERISPSISWASVSAELAWAKFDQLRTLTPVVACRRRDISGLRIVFRFCSQEQQ